MRLLDTRAHLVRKAAILVARFEQLPPDMVEALVVLRQQPPVLLAHLPRNEGDAAGVNSSFHGGIPSVTMPDQGRSRDWQHAAPTARRAAHGCQPGRKRGPKRVIISKGRAGELSRCRAAPRGWPLPLPGPPPIPRHPRTPAPSLRADHGPLVTPCSQSRPALPAAPPLPGKGCAACMQLRPARCTAPHRATGRSPSRTCC